MVATPLWSPSNADGADEDQFDHERVETVFLKMTRGSVECTVAATETISLNRLETVSKSVSLTRVLYSLRACEG